MDLDDDELKATREMNKTKNNKTMLSDILLNLIEKQSKEIEELNYIKRSFDYCVEQENKKWKDKIKAKIEEVDNDENASIPDFMEYAKEYAKKMLQSLLEKE